MNNLPLRSNIEIYKTWKLSDILNEENIEQMIDEVKKLSVVLTDYKKNFNTEIALQVLQTMSKADWILEKLYVYCNMKWDEDKSETKYSELSARINMLLTEYSSVVSFIPPAFSSMKKNDLIKMKNDERYKNFTMFLDEIIRKKNHLLSDKEERILAKTTSFSNDFKTIFSVFDNVNVPFGEIVYEGRKTRLTHGLYSVLLQNEDRNIRKNAYNAMYKGYVSMIDTIAETYAGNVRSDCFYAEIRKYKNSLAQALYADNVPISVYNNLIRSVRKYTPQLHRYMRYRKKVLGYKTLQMYDLHVPIVQGIEKYFPYEDAFDLVCEALSPLGKEYIDTLRLAQKERWIDVEETANKRSGAYSWGVYGTHPYVLLNHKGTVHDVFTIAHEMGHAMHSYYSNRTQCFEKAGYSIFVAEIASTVNEVLLIKHLLKTAVGEERKYYLSYYVDMFRTTLFRQTMFSEFEKFAHETVEQGEALSYRRMCDYYAELNQFYYGKGVNTDNNISYEWARIPHFYNSFYVYKYATGITCAVNIVKKIIENPENVLSYKQFLSMGGSKYPLDIIKIMGIDLTKRTPYDVAMKEFASTLTELIEMK